MLVLLCLVSPLVSLFNGIVLFFYWKPRMTTLARLGSHEDDISETTTLDVRYYVFMVLVFMHLVLGNIFVTFFGMRTLLEQSTPLGRQHGVFRHIGVFTALTCPLFAAHYALYQRAHVVTPKAGVNTSLESTEIHREVAALALVRAALWGTLLSVLFFLWYMYVVFVSDKLQRGVRRIADERLMEKRRVEQRWQQHLRHAVATSVADRPLPA